MTAPLSQNNAFNWRGQPSKSGAYLMRGIVPPNKKNGPLITAGKNMTTKLLHEMRPAKKGNI